MNTLILHHFDWSPFAEKIRLVLGLKGLSWQSVQVPMVPPKIDLARLTGGYRKTPTLQVGADIYCDTRLIARELERRHPSPTLFPRGNRGAALALSHWSDTAFFEPGAGLSMSVNREVPEAVIADRKSFFTFMDFSRLEADTPHLFTQMRANAALVDEQLSDGRKYVFGDAPGWADITAYFPVWMARTFIPSSAEVLAEFVQLTAWEKRMRDVGHGSRSDISAERALDVARDSAADAGAGVDARDALGYAVGDRVTVSPSDYGKVPVTGELVTLAIDEVAVRREDERVGEVVTHFPRIGYRVDRAD